MALRRCRDVDDVGPRLFDHLLHVRKLSGDLESVHHLMRHERVGITDGDDLRVWNSQNLRGMLIGDFAAAHDARPDHRWSFAARTYSKNRSKPSFIPTLGCQLRSLF